MLVICNLAAGGSALKCENTECTNNGTWPLTHFLKQTLSSIAHIKWNTTTVANLGLMHGLYLKIDGASGLKKKRRPTRQWQKPAFYYLASKDRQKWLQKDCQYRKTLKFHTFANWLKFFGWSKSHIKYKKRLQFQMNQKPDMVRWLHTSLYSQWVSKLYNNYFNHIWTKQTNKNAKLKGDGVIFWWKKINVSWKICGGPLLDTAQLGTVKCYI